MKLLPFLLVLGCPWYLVAQVAPPDSPVARWGALHVEKTQLTGAHGEEVVLKGMSLFDTTSYGEYANPAVLGWLRDDWKATVFRAAMYTEYNGKFIGESAYPALFSAVQAAIDTGMYVLVDWHILTDGNPLKHLPEAKDFFSRVATHFGRSPNIIYEICNEPNGNGVTWVDAIKPYALEVIPVIRSLAPDSVIIVGTPVWSSQPEVAALDPLPFPNIMYTLHFYAGTHDSSFLAKIDAAHAAGAAIFVTEWGATNAQVTGTLFVPQALAWASGLEHRRISWANWSLGTKLEPASALKPLASLTGAWKAGELTESGLLMRSLLRGEQRSVVFADSFDSGNFKAGGWQRAGAVLEKNKAFDGTGSVRFEGSASLNKVLKSDAYRDWKWSFMARGEGWSSGDRFFVEWSRDGNSWTTAATFENSDAEWTPKEGTLANVGHVPGLQIRLRAELASASARYWIDDIEVSATRD